jgi:hypothetical protein
MASHMIMMTWHMPHLHQQAIMGGSLHGAETGL